MSIRLLRLSTIVLTMGCLTVPLLAQSRIRIQAGTKIPVRLERAVSTRDFRRWRSFGDVRTVPGTLMQDMVAADGRVALPAGTTIQIAVLEARRAGRVKGRSSLRLGLYSVSTPDGEVIPLDGYPAYLNRRKVDREGTAHGHRGLVKDAAVDITSVAAAGGAGFVVAGPIGAAVGGGGGLLIAALWTVARRGPDLVVPAGTLVEFVLGRPASVVGTGDVVEDAAMLRPARWGRGEAIPPSSDLLELADRLENDPEGVLQQLKDMDFKDRPPVDRTFAAYLEALARFQKGDHSRGTLAHMRQAYRQSRSSPLPSQARAEMARNLVVVLRATEPDWEHDPLLNDPQVQSALVEDMQ